MSNIYEELSNALSMKRKLEKDLEAIQEAADQVPIDKKTQDKIEYFKNQKEAKEQKNSSDLSMLQSKRDSVEQKFDAEIEALKQKKELALTKIDTQITKIEKCTTIAYYEKEIEKLLDSVGANRIKSQVEIRKEKELEDVNKRVRELEDYERMERASKAMFERNREATQARYAREAELAKQEQALMIQWHEEICKRNPVKSTLDDEDDFLPENIVVNT